MNPTLQIKATELASERSALATLFASVKNADGGYKPITDEIDKDITARQDKIKALEGEIKTIERIGQLELNNDEGLKALGSNGKERTLPNDGSGRKAFMVPARARVSVVKSFKGVRGGFEPEERAYRLGMWFWAINGSRKAVAACKTYGIDLITVTDDGDEIKTHTEGVPAAGGVLVPEEFSADIINLKEIYGKFRQNAGVTPMLYDTKHVPRRTGGLTATWTAEATAITESTMAWDYVDLVAKKLACLAKYSTELGEDALVDIGDTLAEDMAWAFSRAEDLAGFNGDGTATYGGITGLGPKFVALGTAANSAGIIIAPVQTAANGYGAIILDNFTSMQGRLPQYAVERDDVKWYCSRNFFYSVMLNLALKAGGVSEAEVIAGQVNPRFLGYPVVIVQVMPSVFAVSQICCYFGSLSLAALLGDRRMMTIATSAHLNFAEDLLAIRATERLDINVHDIGNNNASAALRVPGPIVALQTAAT